MAWRSAIPSSAILLAVAMFLALAAANILTPLLPLIQAEFAISYAVAGVLVSAFGLARLALDLPTGFLQDRFGGRRLAIAAFVLLIGGSLLATIAPTFAALVAGRVAMGLGASMLSVVVLTALSMLAPEHARTRVLALYAMANNTAIAVFPVVGGIVGSLWGWRSTMALSGLLALIGAVLIGRVLPRLPPRSSPPATPTGAHARLSSLSLPLMLALGTIFFGVVVNMINRHGFRNTVLPLFASDELGLNPVQIASGISVVAVMGLVMAMPGSLLADRWSRRGVIAAGMIVLAIGDLAFLGATSYRTFLLAALILGLGDFFAASQTAALTEIVPASLRGRVLAAYRFAVDLGATVGPFLLASLLGAIGFSVTIVLTAGLLLIASAVVPLGGLAALRPAAPPADAASDAR